MSAILNDLAILLNKEINIKFLFAVFVFFSLDFITGIAKGVKTKKFSSSKFRGSVSKLLCYVAILIVGIMCDFLFNIEWCIKLTSGYLISVEFTSIVENVGKNGLQIPQKIIDLFNKIN